VKPPAVRPYQIGQHLGLGASATALSPEEQLHWSQCLVCQALYPKVAAAPPEGKPTPSSDRVLTVILTDLKPVKPIPSPWVLAVAFTALVAVLLALAAWLIGAAGFFALSAMAKMLMLSILGIGTLLFSFSLAQRMIPGSLQRVPVLQVALALAIAFIFVVGLMFHDVTDWKTLAMQRTCLWLGIAAAVVTATLSSMLVRRGAWINRFATVVSIGALSGVSALLVLTVHCPILKATHILLWHGGAAAVAILAAWLVGRRFE
jgi:Negative regulator of sigma F